MKIQKTEPWKLLYTNIRGLKGKIIGLNAIIQDHTPQLFLLTETQLRSTIAPKIQGYTFYGKTREGKIGGGVGIYVRNDVTPYLTCHISERNIEIIWVNIRQKNKSPIIIGTYYGKQETRTSKSEIEQEIQLLNEEINEMKREGEIVLAMDGNAKIGILENTLSRNGKLLNQIFENNSLTLMNKSTKCVGRITRKNTKNPNEISAIDFVVATDEASKWIQRVLIDEDGLLKVKGRNETDHNTIQIDLEVTNADYVKPPKQTTWNIRASDEKWNEFNVQLKKRLPTATNILQNNDIPTNEKYTKWFREIDQAARDSIGKTTLKLKKQQKTTKLQKDLRNKKKKLRNQIQAEKDKDQRALLINNYKNLQERTKEQIANERSSAISHKFQKIIKDKTWRTFWREKKTLTRNPALDSIALKNESGNRVYSPTEIKETTANYFKNLYKRKIFPFHPYHQTVTDNMKLFETNREYESTRYNQEPTIEELTRIIKEKKNGKSTPDIKNEMIKKPGINMIEFLHPLIKTVWKEEKIPVSWNTGHITTVYKGKGDKEDLHNYRGITTSSAIGTIIETMIDKRIETYVPYTQAQGGGKRGASTCDHLFLLRAMIDTSIKQKRPTFLTFYDVSKAYDNVDNNDMLNIMWEKGLRGKTWRILHNLNNDLKALVKTRHGPTETIEMEIGGKQGSRLTGRMFAKMMDMLAEDIQPTNEGYKLNDELTIPVLLWVDDVVSCTDNSDNQKKMLNTVADFAIKHKLKWGANKCNVMRVGKHDKKQSQWKLGELTIDETDSYKYLGDLITNDGKNRKNLDLRKNKLTAAITTINAIAETDTLRRIETTVLLELHEKITIPILLNNAESWNLNKGELERLEKIEIQVIKHLFDLPAHTPTPAILYSLGIPYTAQRLDKIRLVYLHRILKRYDQHWTKITLNHLISMNIGWGKNINEYLKLYDLPEDHNEIKSMTLRAWKTLVTRKVEIKNTQRLRDDCYKTSEGIRTPKTKTAHIIEKIESPTYQRKTLDELKGLTKHETKTIIIARFGMLECGSNFKGSMGNICKKCSVTDDENHRLNTCSNYNASPAYVNFDDIYSCDVNVLTDVIKGIEELWNTKTAHGTMKL